MCRSSSLAIVCSLLCVSRCAEVGHVWKNGDPAPIADVLQSELVAIERRAKQLFEDGELFGEAVRSLDTELEMFERRLLVHQSDEHTNLGGNKVQELYFMVSILRGTIYQQGRGLSDEQIEKSRNAYTFSNPRFWEEYYAKHATVERFDWYGSWDTKVFIRDVENRNAKSHSQESSTVGNLMLKLIPKDAQILMIGCGRSDMSENMYKNGFENITNIDVSSDLLDGLRAELEVDMPKMRWIRMDASAMSFPAAAFDVVIDKGTLDSLQENFSLLRATILEARRVLNPGGIFLSLTDAPRDHRVRDQLKRYTYWGYCWSHELYLDSQGGGLDAQILYVHSCSRSHDTWWTRFWSALQIETWTWDEL